MLFRGKDANGKRIVTANVAELVGDDIEVRLPGSILWQVW